MLLAAQYMARVSPEVRRRRRRRRRRRGGLKGVDEKGEDNEEGGKRLTNPPLFLSHQVADRAIEVLGGQLQLPEVGRERSNGTKTVAYLLSLGAEHLKR